MSNQLLNTKNIRKGAKGSFTVPKDFSPEGKRFAQSVVDNIQQLTGEKGNSLDKAVTFNDLVNAGIAKKQFVLTDGGSNFVIGPGDNQGVGTPTAPTGASASGAFQNILIAWDFPSYRGHSHTEIFVSTTDDFASAEISKGRLSPKFLGQTTASVFSHQVAAGSTRYYWIRHVNQNDFAGPTQGTSGLQASTALIDTALIQDNLITAAKIVDGAVSTVKIATDAVTNAKIAVDAIQGDVIAAGAITEAKIGASAITTTKIADDAISTPKISANAITASEIASNAITSVKINANAITTAKIISGAVTAAEIATNAVTSDKINANAVSADKIAANSIAASKMVAGTITASSGIIADAAILSAKIADGAIVNAKIADAAIDNAKISSLNASKINAGQINSDRIQIDDVTLDTDGSGNLVIGNFDAYTHINTGTMGSIEGTAGNDVLMTNLNSISTSIFVNASPHHIAKSSDTVVNPDVAANAVMGGTTDNANGSPLFQYGFTTPAFSGTRQYIIQCIVDPIGLYSSDSRSMFAMAMRQTSSATAYTSTNANDYVTTRGTSKGGTRSSETFILNDVVSLSPNSTYYIWVFGALEDVGDGGHPSVDHGVLNGTITVQGLSK